MRLRLRDRLPFPRDDSERLMRDTRDLVIASVSAGLAVAAVQGLVGGVAFWLLGLGAPVVWGVVIALCSLIPVVGAALVWVPAGIGLLLAGRNRTRPDDVHRRRARHRAWWTTSCARCC